GRVLAVVERVAGDAQDPDGVLRVAAPELRHGLFHEVEDRVALAGVDVEGVVLADRLLARAGAVGDDGVDGLVRLDEVVLAVGLAEGAELLLVGRAAGGPGNEQGDDRQRDRARAPPRPSARRRLQFLYSLVICAVFFAVVSPVFAFTI